MTPPTLRRIRQLHLYIGVFFTPALLFFAISGGLQTFRLQQASGWGGAPPPAWMAWMGSVHIDQARLRPEPAKPAAARPPPSPAEAAERAARKRAVLPMKIFTAGLAAALALSALLGATIALNMRSTRRIAAIMLAAGSVLPILLLA